MNATIENDFENSTVTELVLAAQAGDREAFGQLVERFEKAIFAIALRRLGNYAAAQELTQDVFIQAMLKLEQLQNPVCFGGWLKSIAHRLAINRLIRKRADRPYESDVLEVIGARHDSPLATLIANERTAQVRDGLSKLGEMDRDTLVAFYVNGRSLIEMSDEFAAPIGTIKRRLHVARKRLAREVGELAAV